jgi:hypothetical protein
MISSIIFIPLWYCQDREIKKAGGGETFGKHKPQNYVADRTDGKQVSTGKTVWESYVQTEGQ